MREPFLFPRRRGMASSLQAVIGSAANALVAGLVAPLVMQSARAMALTSSDAHVRHSPRHALAKTIYQSRPASTRAPEYGQRLRPLSGPR